MFVSRLETNNSNTLSPPAGWGNLFGRSLRSRKVQRFGRRTRQVDLPGWNRVGWIVGIAFQPSCLSFRTPTQIRSCPTHLTNTPRLGGSCKPRQGNACRNTRGLADHRRPDGHALNCPPRRAKRSGCLARPSESACLGSGVTRLAVRDNRTARVHPCMLRRPTPLRERSSRLVSQPSSTRMRFAAEQCPC